jgi:hypothetical protein
MNHNHVSKFRRILFRIGLLLGGIVFYAQAPAAHAGYSGPQGLASVTPRGLMPMILNVPPQGSILPLPDEIRKFANEEEYYDWLRSTFDFTIEGGREFTTIVTVGQAFAYNADLSALVPVSDPVATFIGGRLGMIEIGGKSYCVDGSRCGNAVDPFSLMPMILRPTLGTLFPAGDESVRAELDYHRETLAIHDHEKGWKEHARMQAITVQESNGTQIVAWNPNPTPRLVCDSLLATLEGPNCYWIPEAGEAWIQVVGSNELTTELAPFGKIVDVNGKCHDVMYDKWVERARDVSRLEVRTEVYGWENDTHLHRPTSVRSVHGGTDGNGSLVGTELQLPTDVPPEC